MGLGYWTGYVGAVVGCLVVTAALLVLVARVGDPIFGACIGYLTCYAFGWLSGRAK